MCVGPSDASSCGLAWIVFFPSWVSLLFFTAIPPFCHTSYRTPTRLPARPFFITQTKAIAQFAGVVVGAEYQRVRSMLSLLEDDWWRYEDLEQYLMENEESDPEDE